MAFLNAEDILADKIRCAPVLQTLESGEYDLFLVKGSSLRVRDTKAGYFRFVINNAEDIPALTDGITGLLHRFFAIDADYIDSWRAMFPEAEYNHYRMSVAARDNLRTLPDSQLPDDLKIVPMDESWEELMIEHCADDEFSADSFRRQLMENLSLGLVWNGERAGFYSKHLNGEMGPFWVAPEARCRGFGTLLKREYTREYLKHNTIGFGLIAVENEALVKTNESLGIALFKKTILHVTLSNTPVSVGNRA